MKLSYRVTLALIASVALGAAAVTGLKAQVKPPVYVVIDISELSDPAAFAKAAAVASPQELASVGGRYLIRYYETDCPRRIGASESLRCHCL